MQNLYVISGNRVEPVRRSRTGAPPRSGTASTRESASPWSSPRGGTPLLLQRRRREQQHRAPQGHPTGEKKGLERPFDSGVRGIWIDIARTPEFQPSSDSLSRAATLFIKINVAVVYHYTHGHTKRRADSVMRCVQEAGDVTATISTRRKWLHLGWMSSMRPIALIFGCPTYMGSMFAGMDSFLEVAAKKWLALAWEKQNCGGSPIRPHFPRINSTLFSDWSAMRCTMA